MNKVLFSRTYDGDLPAEMILDIPCLDGIGRIFCDHLIEVCNHKQ
jgi:hypothetical protein